MDIVANMYLTHSEQVTWFNYGPETITTAVVLLQDIRSEL